MILFKDKRRGYEPPYVTAFKISTQGVLCQSGENLEMQTQNMENPVAPSGTDHSW